MLREWVVGRGGGELLRCDISNGGRYAREMSILVIEVLWNFIIVVMRSRTCYSLKPVTLNILRSVEKDRILASKAQSLLRKKESHIAGDFSISSIHTYRNIFAHH